MAIRKSFILSGNNIVQCGDFVIPLGKKDVVFDAYIKVDSIAGTKNAISASVSFTGNNGKFYKSYDFSPSLEGNNFIAQAYDYMKTLPEFSGAEDC